MILPCNLESVEKIAEYAKNEPVVIPTDTLYGLSMSIYADISKIYSLKRRDLEKKIPIGVADVKMMEEIAIMNSTARKIVKKFMPGAVTVILKNKNLRNWGEKIAVRIPNHIIPLELARRIGPITLTSANISGDREPVTIEDTMKLDVRYRIDCGKLSGTHSTIVDLTDEIKLIRDGAIPIPLIKSLEE